MASIEHAIVDFLAQLFTAIGWPGVVIAMAIESACIPLPSEVTLPLAGWMLVQAPGGSRVRPNGRASFGQLCGIGGRRTFRHGQEILL